jgi:hypothetical protein
VTHQGDTQSKCLATQVKQSVGLMKVVGEYLVASPKGKSTKAWEGEPTQVDMTWLINALTQTLIQLDRWGHHSNKGMERSMGQLGKSLGCAHMRGRPNITKGCDI